MRGIVLTRFGDPAKVLELKTLPDPPPPGPGEVVVRVTKRVIHPGNLVMIRGGFNIPIPADGFLVSGADGVGVGEGVDSAQSVKPGARVIFNPSPGAWAERLKTRIELVTPIPDDLPDAVAAQLLSRISEKCRAVFRKNPASSKALSRDALASQRISA